MYGIFKWLVCTTLIFQQFKGCANIVMLYACHDNAICDVIFSDTYYNYLKPHHISVCMRVMYILTRPTYHIIAIYLPSKITFGGNLVLTRPNQLLHTTIYVLWPTYISVNFIHFFVLRVQMYE